MPRYLQRQATALRRRFPTSAQLTGWYTRSTIDWGRHVYMSFSCDVTKTNVTQLAFIDTNKYRKVLIEFPEILRPTFTCITVSHGVQHYVPTTGPPMHVKAGRLSSDKQAIVKKDFAEMESMGIIRKSNSVWASPLHIVPKPNGGCRPCGDYILLNDVTTSDQYPIPHMQDSSAQLAGMNIFPRLI